MSFLFMGLMVPEGNIIAPLRPFCEIMPFKWSVPVIVLIMFMSMVVMVVSVMSVIMRLMVMMTSMLMMVWALY